MKKKIFWLESGRSGKKARPTKDYWVPQVSWNQRITDTEMESLKNVS